MYHGENICSQSLAVFKYKYEEKGKDTGELTFRFADPIPFSLEVFTPGTFFSVRWGYIGNLSPHRKVAINSLSTTYSAGGYTLTMEIIPIADYKDAGSKWESVLEGIKDGLKFGYSWWDERGTNVQVDIVLREGGLAAETSVNQAFYGVERAVPSFTDNWLKFYGGIVEPLRALGMDKPNFGRTLEDSLEMKLDEITQTLKQMFTEYLANRLPGYFIESRDDEFIAKPVDSSSPALFSIRAKDDSGPLQVLSISLAKGSTAAQGIVQVATTIGLLDKSVATQESVLTSDNLPLELVKTDYLGRPSDTIAQIFLDPKNDNLPSIEYYETGAVELADQATLDKATVTLQERINTVNRLEQTAKKQQQARDIRASGVLEEKDPITKPHLSPTIFGEPMSQVDLTADLKKGFETFQARSKEQLAYKGKLSEANLDALMVKRGFAVSLEEAKNRITSNQLDNFFNSLQCKVTIEGVPLFDVGFNFNIQGMGDLNNGKYHLTKCSHTISGGKYTTTLEGGKIPIIYTHRINQQIQYVEELYSKFSPTDMRRLVIPNVNDAINDPELQKVLAGNHRVWERARGDKKIKVKTTQEPSGLHEAARTSTRKPVDLDSSEFE